MKKIQLKTEAALLVLTVLPLLYLWLSWPELPERVAMHFNLQGEADGWTGKNGLIWLTLSITLGIYLLLLFLPALDPKKQISKMGNKYNHLRFILSFFMVALAVFIIYNASNHQALNPEFILILVGALIAVLGNYFQAIKPNYFIGLRTPWTLESEYVWRKTHRMAGPLWIVGGIAMALLSFIQHTDLRQYLFYFIAGALIVVPFVYSFRASKKEQNLKETH